MSYDVVAGALVAWLLSQRKLEKTSPVNLSMIQGAGVK
jgi:hypothetical protein